MTPRQARIAAASIVAVACTAVAASAAGAATPRAYRLEQAITLQPGQQATYSLVCDAGDAVTDGVWDLDPGSGTVAVLQARAFSGQGFRFTLRDDDDQPARMHLYIACQDAAGGVQPAGAAVATTPGVVRCRAGTISVAPGFGLGDAARVLVAPVPNAPVPNSLLPPVLPPVSVPVAAPVAAAPVAPLVSGRCIRAPGARLRSVSRRVTVPAGRTSSYTVTCAKGSTLVTSTITLRDATLVGQVPHARTRTITLAPSAAHDGAAVLGARCLRPR